MLDKQMTNKDISTTEIFEILKLVKIIRPQIRLVNN